MLKNSVIVILLIWSSVNSYLIYSSDMPEEDATDLKLTVAENAEKIESNSLNIQKILNKSIALNEKVVRKEKLRNTEHQNEDLIEAEKGEPVSDKEKLEENLALKNEAALLNLARKMSSEKNFDLSAHSSQIFNSEKFDMTWSGQYENNITELFSSNELLFNTPLKNVECRSTVCKLEVFANDSTPINIANSFASSLSQQKWRDPEATFTFEQKLNNGILSIYVGRDEESLSIGLE